MKAHKITILLAIAAALVAVVITGCSGNTGTTGGGQSGGGSQNQTQAVDPSGLIRTWAESTHSVPVVFAAEEAPCAGCHDGRAFAQGVKDPKDIQGPQPFGPWPTPTTCVACHTGQGQQLMQSGTTTLPTSPQQVQGGLGAMCMGCHNQWTPPNINNKERGYAHYGDQGDVLFGTAGMRSGDMTVTSTQRHSQVQDSCVGCHMTSDRAASHAFQPNTEQCRRCHQNFESTATVQAGADYDGDGSTEAFVQEVDGLMAQVYKATNAAAKSTSFAGFQGQIVFKSGNTTMTAVPNNAYLGAYNYITIEHDKSNGIHNPGFTVSLLQSTYRFLTGNAVPNAAPFKSRTGSGGTGSSGGTRGTGGANQGTGAGTTGSGATTGGAGTTTGSAPTTP